MEEAAGGIGSPTVFIFEKGAAVLSGFLIYQVLRFDSNELAE